MKEGFREKLTVGKAGGEEREGGIVGNVDGFESHLGFGSANE